MKLYYRQYSESGPPVVLLHGLYGNQANLAWHARKLAENFAVHALDARNHGQSPRSDSMTLEEMAADLVETLDALGLDRVSLMGHSMGGKVAMLCALQQPHRVQSLVIIDIAPVDYHKPADKVIGALLDLDLHEIAGRSDADNRLSKHIPEKGVRDFLLTNLQRATDGSFTWRINLPVIAEFFPLLTGWPTMKTSYGAPVLFIRGEHSDYILPAHADSINSHFPGAKVITVSGAGHWVHSEKQEAVLRLAQRFLENSVE